MREYGGRVRAVSALTGIFLAAALLLPATASAALDGGGGDRAGRTPVVVFPAFHFTKLEVTVRNQVVAPECPRSGTFEDWFLNDEPSTTFSQVCQDKLMTLRISNRGPKSKRFQDQQGVTRRSRRPGTCATGTSAWPATTRASLPTCGTSSIGRRL
jgi:lysophospholipase-3